MNEAQQNHPLHGVKLESLLGELVRHYGWEVLAEQINIRCFKHYPNFDSSLKFLRKTAWAREKLEAFYLYRFKQFELPDDDQHQLPPRERVIDITKMRAEPAVIELGDGEFFDDPISGPVFPSKKQVASTKKMPTHTTNTSRRSAQKSNPTTARSDNGADDPWAKWKK